MHQNEGFLESAAHLLHRYFLPLLLATYVLAGCLPGLGLAIRSLSFGQITLFGEGVRISPSMVMLAVLMFNAAVSIQSLRGLISSPGLLSAGLAANILIPILVLYPFSFAMNQWGSPENLQAVIVALALVSAVPVAGSSTAYTQNADGDMSLAVGLVLASTFLSPWLMPFSLDLINHAAVGDYTAAFREFRGGGAVPALFLSVLLPSAAGLAVRTPVGIGRIKSAKPALKVVNTFCLLLLNYTAASAALPKIVASPDWRFLLWAFPFMTGLCLVDFLSGWWIARLLKAKPSQCLAMMFGVGMNNSGTALVLASMVFSNRPKILVPIIFYALVQQVIAGASLLLPQIRNGVGAETAPAR